jgi:N-acetylglucosamine kinase-like BadF-type ATPase
MKYILGVDGGATKTTAVIATAAGEKLAESVSSASNFLSVGVENAIKNLNNAVYGAMEKAGIGKDAIFESSGFGFAGFNVPDDLITYRKIVENEKLKKHLKLSKTLICNDTRIGLEAGSSAENKIIIIAGTGSNCFGVNERGEQAGATGWDYILADEGSGYSVSIKALRAVMREYDGRGKKTMLTGEILKKLDLKKAIEIVNWVYGRPFSKKRIGQFSEVVCRCAYRGDSICIKILHEEAMESVLSVESVARKLGLLDKRTDLVFVGGLFRCEKYFKDVVTKELKSRFDNIDFSPLIEKPVSGAVKLAIDNL